MTIVFSDHAKKQNLRRNIPIDRIKCTLQNPDEILTSYRKRKLYRKAYSDRILEVVIIEERDIMIVITQYYLDI